METVAYTRLLRIFFFFSSRRRHTRCSRDWSSDVCSSDLHHRVGRQAALAAAQAHGAARRMKAHAHLLRRGDGVVQPSAIRIQVQVVARSEEHTSELQSRLHLVCRLLLEKKKKQKGESYVLLRRHRAIRSGYPL